MNGARWLVQALEAEGVETLFGYPGGTIMPVKEAYELGSSMAEKMLTHTPGPATDQVSNGVQSCAC